MSAEFATAGMLRRLASACYDVLVLAGVVMLSTFVIVVARGGEAIPPGNRAFAAFLVAEAGVYFVAFWSRGGQTPGMRAWDLRIEGAPGQPLSIARAALRFLAAVASIAPAGLGFLSMLVDPERRTVYDRVSNSRVIRVRSARTHQGDGRGGRQEQRRQPADE